jgi:Immunity protein 49
MFTQDQLLSSVEFSLQQMPALIEKIRYRIKPIDVRACYGSLSQDHLKVGIYDYFIKEDIKSFKQHLYISSKLKLAAVAIDSYQQFSSRELFFALLSDNLEVISTMAKLLTEEFKVDINKPSSQYFYAHMLQLAILGEYDKLQSKIAQMAERGRKIDDRASYQEGKDFFSLLIKSNKSELEALINKKANLKSDDPLIVNFMSYLACMQAKTCWFRGIEVQINHPLVPMELMPIKPLEHYEDIYDFLMPDWQPPKRTLFGRLFGMK